jgi:XTP/dITP diphosphohydrolase
MLLYVCSTNRGKLTEFELAAGFTGGLEIEIRPLPELQRVEAPEETGATFEENAALKALYYSRLTPEPVLADDSGLEADALGGEPGVFSARYAGPEATDSENIQLLLKKLQPELNRHARFVCMLALAQDGKLLLAAGGTVEGEILEEPIGDNGFGYDPVFFYPPLNQSFAQLTPETKFSVSHRGNALRSFFEKLGEAQGRNRTPSRDRNPGNANR